MVGVNGHDMDGDGLARRWGEERERVPMAEGEDAEEGELKLGGFQRKELGGDQGAEERTPLPGRSKAACVIGVEVR